MKPEPLKGKVRGRRDYKDLYHGEDIRAAVEWYLIYKENEEKLIKDYPKLIPEILVLFGYRASS